MSATAIRKEKDRSAIIAFNTDSTNDYIMGSRKVISLSTKSESTCWVLCNEEPWKH